MTKFEPEVAYQILKEKQERYFSQGKTLIREKTRLWVNGILTPWAEEWFEREIRDQYDCGADMWDVLDYLRKRIEEEKHDTV